ncbi:MAG: hypothetical protein AAGI30_08240 [Planctomycetota bacterium]
MWVFVSLSGGLGLNGCANAERDREEFERDRSGVAAIDHSPLRVAHETRLRRAE